MIQVYSVMWVVALVFAVLGFTRGWNRELLMTGSILLALYAIFQFDALMRASIYRLFTPDTVFLAQAGIFGAVVFIAFQADITSSSRRRRNEGPGWQSNLLGSLVGFVNGYLIAGSIWYFLDINSYPLSQFITAPAVNSPSAQNLGIMPMVLLGGGASGSGDLLAAIVVGLLFLVLVVL